MNSMLYCCEGFVGGSCLRGVVHMYNVSGISILHKYNVLDWDINKGITRGYNVF